MVYTSLTSKALLRHIMEPKNSIRIQHNSHIPVYKQIEASIKEQIKTGTLEPYDKIWSEREMAQIFGVSRMTARLATSHLIREDHLFTAKGKGTFVSKQKIDQPILKLKNFFQEMEDLNLLPSSFVLDHGEFVNKGHSEGQLDVPPGTRLFFVKRIMSGNGTPYVLETKTIVRKHCSLLHDWAGKEQEIVDVLSGRCQRCVKKYDIFVESTILNEEESRIFGLSAGGPAFCVKKYVYNSGQEQISFIKSIYRGDLYRFHSTIEY